uniref:Homeobox and leucine zipper encoding a n=1 Tax=Erpetoichthys calabaricus TaxID=27687 RepID=A0A8C4SJT9_ERPCA
MFQSQISSKADSQKEEGLKLVWTQSDQTSELDSNEYLMEAFNKFPYPSASEISLLFWFMVQRIKYGISWSSEEIEEHVLNSARKWTLPKLRGQGIREEKEWRVNFEADAEDIMVDMPCSSSNSGVFNLPPGRYKKSKAQLATLRSSFSRQHFPNEAELRRLQQQTGLSRNDIRKWFSDSRYQMRNSELQSDETEPMLFINSKGEAEYDKPHHTTSTLRKVKELLHTPSCLSKNSHELPGTQGNQSVLTPSGRPRKTKEQLNILKSFFLQCQWPKSADYTRLVQQTGLPRPDVIQWFGDTRYAVKNGQLRWVRGSGVGTDIATEIKQQQNQHSPYSRTDIRPLEKYLRTTGYLQEKDLDHFARNLT